MSRCGSCDLYWPNGKENFGVVCQGDCSTEECAENLQDLVNHLIRERRIKLCPKQNLSVTLIFARK